MMKLVTSWKVLVIETATVKEHLILAKLPVVEKHIVILEQKFLVTMTERKTVSINDEKCMIHLYNEVWPQTHTTTNEVKPHE